MEFQNVPLDPLLPNAAALPPPRVAAPVMLMCTIALETAGTLLLKRPDQASQALAFLCYFSSLGLFSHVLRYIALPVAYATWCTLGTVGVTLLSVLVYDETLRPAQYVCLAASVPCVVGLHVL